MDQRLYNKRDYIYSYFPLSLDTKKNCTEHLAVVRMRLLSLRSRSLKRLFSVSIGQWRNKEEEEEETVSTPITIESKNPPQKPNWKCFSFEKIHQATNGFHQDNLVGRGGYAEVYKGVLENSQAIAVKRLTSACTNEQREKEFLTELGTIGHVSHRNVSALLGFCIDGDLYLVFEFSSLGSVSSYLHGENSPPMPWKIRYKVVAGTAEGLHYLHKGCQRRIIHRDIKASNILLTTNFEPQISDFGLARWLPSEWTHRAVAPIEGTFGCLAPEYFMHGIVDEKTDVFAFGVFILEVISGRKPVDGSHKSLLSWAKPYLSDGTIHIMVDPRLGENYDVQQLRRLTFVASLCIRAASAWRPSMTEVLNLIKEKDEILPDNWKMPEDEEEEEFWGFDDLDECDNDGLAECDTPSSSSSMGSSS